MTEPLSIVFGGTSGIGRRLAERLAERGPVVITGRDTARTQGIAAEIGPQCTGIAVDLAEPLAIAGALAGLGPVRNVVLAAIERDRNTLRDYAVDRATRLATIKLVGYSEAVHALASRLTPDASIVLFGGLAKDRPYPGSTTVTAVNGAVTSMVRSFAIELAPVRCNAVHPGIVGDTPAWENNQAALSAVIERTPIGRTVTTEEVTDATLFLLDNQGVNGVNLVIDGGTLLR